MFWGRDEQKSRGKDILYARNPRGIRKIWQAQECVLLEIAPGMHFLPANPVDEGANTASRKADIYDSVTGVTCQCRDCQRGEVNEAVETFCSADCSHVTGKLQLPDSKDGL